MDTFKSGLSIDGGGMRGIVPCVILKHIEEVTGKPTHELFDIVAGTSTGGLLALLLGIKLSAKEVLDLYKNNGTLIFKKRILGFLLGRLFGPKYSSEGIKKISQKAFGSAMINSVAMPVMAISYCTDQGMPKVWKSWSDSVSCVDVVLATSAAPTYFPAHKIGAHGYIDGGICANSPSACLASEMLRLYGNDIKLLSLGCGERVTKMTAKCCKEWGYIGWGKHIIDVMMGGSSQIEDYMCTVGLGQHYVRIQKQLPSTMSGELDCIKKEDIRRLEAFGEHLWEENKDKILKHILE